jgi:hypothetical protein
MAEKLMEKRKAPVNFGPLSITGVNGNFKKSGKISCREDSLQLVGTRWTCLPIFLAKIPF